MNWRIPLADIDYGPEEAEAVQRVLESRWLTMGAVTRQFELEFATFNGSQHAVAVTNATAGLHLACLAAGVSSGDEVILPALTFVASANAVRYTGATPVFADIESLGWWNISPAEVERLVTERTRAVMVVHYGGYACDMPAILEVARRHNLAVIEDAAHAAGSSLDGRKLGAWGQSGCYSFFSNKNMTTGEGGMLVTDDETVAEKFSLLRSHGMTSLTWDRHRGHAWSYDVVDLGYNYRIDELRAALGRVQLAKLEKNNARRRELVGLYREMLAELAPEVGVPFAEPRGVSAAHLMPVLLPAGADRTDFMERMKERGIQTSIHYPPVHHFSSFDGHPRPDLPLTETVAAREVTLPLYPAMSDGDVELVVRALVEAGPRHL